ncbi:MAG: GNAT family N-acetyltransferase [Candidatus Tenebribacter burtonii]|nr:GNAT family N-acetyltransferase [Candidatus Tenebribacter burtonii]
MVNYRIVRELDNKRWSEFVSNHGNGNIFQTHEMYKVYKDTKKYEPVFLAVIDNDDDILGLLLAVIQREYSGFLGNFTARSIIYGGPLIRNENADVLNIILQEYNKTIKRKAIYSQFRNMWNWTNLKDIFINNGFEYEEHLNILVNLNKSEDELWKDVHSKRRNEIRRAIKEGTSFYTEKSINELRECYSILQSVYDRAKLPLPDFSLFENILGFSDSRMGLQLFCAKYENRIIGCMIALLYKKTIYDFYAGAIFDFYNKYPNDLIPWEVFKWGGGNNFETFDFGGAGKPDVPYGVRDYKKKFGGNLVNYGRFEKVNKPLFMKIGKIGLKIKQKF